MAEAAHRLLVGRLRKPHGLRGDCAVFPLTDDPGGAFAPGRQVWVLDLEGNPMTGPLEISRSREFHRQWLVAFRGHPDRSAVQPYGGAFLAVPAEQLTPPAPGEVYLDELVGFAVREENGAPLGLVSGWYELPAGLTLEVQGPQREFLLPFRKELVLEVDRDGRRLTVRLPEGMLEL